MVSVNAGKVMRHRQANSHSFRFFLLRSESHIHFVLFVLPGQYGCSFYNCAVTVEIEVIRRKNSGSMSRRRRTLLALVFRFSSFTPLFPFLKVNIAQITFTPIPSTLGLFQFFVPQGGLVLMQVE